MKDNNPQPTKPAATQTQPTTTPANTETRADHLKSELETLDEDVEIGVDALEQIEALKQNK